jgi:hypothetical protein
MFSKRLNGDLFKTCVTCQEKSKACYAKKKEEDQGYAARKMKAYVEREKAKDPDGFRERVRRASRKQRDKKLEEDPEGFRRRQNERNRAYTQRQLVADPEGFRARKNANTKKYRDANRDALLAKNRENDRLSVKRRLNTFKTPVRSRGYEWALADDDAMDIMTGPCMYCGILPVDCVHGLDRMDNSRGYTPENTVGCCGTCNMMKKCLDAHTFVDRCTHLCGLERHDRAWPDTRPGPFASYRNNAKKRKRSFELTKADYDALIQQPCVYCHRTITQTNKSGIDRIDNDLGYVAGNMQPCCTECNRMRGTLTIDAFLEKATHIAARAELLRIPEMPTCLLAMTPRRTQKPKTRSRGRDTADAESTNTISRPSS